MNLVERLKELGVSADCDLLGIDRNALRAEVARHSPPYWMEQILLHDDACDLDELIADACVDDEKARLRAYARIGAVIVGIARDDIDARIRRAIDAMRLGDLWNA